MTKRILPFALVALSCGVACTEPATRRTRDAAAPALEARLALSDSAPRPGTPVRVVVQLTGEHSSDIASFTGRLRYDFASLRFVGEAPIDDGATRIWNPTPGVVRVGAIAASGFRTGTLAAFDFLVLRANGTRSLALDVDEMHSIARRDVTASLRVLDGTHDGRIH
ncbi:MAG TPA: hypothetical protein VF785_24090 [Gemmatimonadaceae bacterium]